jgi:hypothetical protein
MRVVPVSDMLGLHKENGDQALTQARQDQPAHEVDASVDAHESTGVHVADHTVVFDR